MQKQRATLFGIRIETFDGSDDEHVVGFHFNTYRDNGRFHPVVPIGRKNTMSNIASTRFVFVDLGRAMTSDDAFAFGRDHARFAKYRDQMIALWNGNGKTSNDDAAIREENAQLKARKAELEAELEKLRNGGNVATSTVDADETFDADESEDARELRELGVS